MSYIGLLSDTHSIFDDKLKLFFKDVDEIWHSGDFGCSETSDSISAMKPLRGVYGNCDGKDIRIIHPLIQLFEMEGMRFLMTHIGGYPGRYDYAAFRMILAHKPNVFISGHSHILKVMNDTSLNMMTINSGAAGLQGFHAVRTAIRFRVSDGRLHDMEVGEWER